MQTVHQPIVPITRRGRWLRFGFAAAGLATLLFGGCAEGGPETQAVSFTPAGGYTRSRADLTRAADTQRLYAPLEAERDRTLAPAQPPPTTTPAVPPTGAPSIAPATNPALDPAADAAELRSRRMELANRERWRNEDCLRGVARAEQDRARVNLWTSALDDPKSTFGLDVDTAAFAIARDCLRRNELPPAEMVRTEEIVNYFDYRDPARPGQTFTVNAEMAPTPFAPKSYLLRIGLRAKPIAAAERQPANLTFVVDVSGSMAAPNRLPLVRQSLHDLVDRLRPDDRVAIVIFSNRAECWLNPTSAHYKDEIHRIIDNLQVGGATSIEEGLTLGYSIATRNLEAGHTSRVILCSDGEANVGTTSPEILLREIANHRKQGVYLSTIGFGLKNYNDELLETLADRGDGHYDHIDRIDEADKVFGERLTSMLEVVAQDAKIQVEFNPDRVAEYRLLGYENRAIADRDFRNDRIDAGEVGAGHAVTALYEITLRDPAGAAGDLPPARQEARAAVDAAIDALVPAAPTGAPTATPPAPTPARPENPAPPAPTASATPADPHRRAEVAAPALPALSHLAVIRLRYKEPPATRNAPAVFHDSDYTPPSANPRALECSFTLTDQVIVPELSKASDDFRLALAASQFSELLRGSPYAARADIDAVLALLRSVELDRPQDDKVQDLYDMALTWKQLYSVTRLSRREGRRDTLYDNR